MKILFISMPSIHIIRWVENLEDTSYELFWFDVLGRGRLATIDKVYQITNWGKRKLPYIKGEYWLSKKLPKLHAKIQPFIEVTANEALENIINEIQPDVIHSFEMQSCSYPILNTMKKYPNIKWLYSCWGSDLFYYQNFKDQILKIRQVLERIDFLHTDCMRDFELAKQLGFTGKYIGVIPGGGGYELSEYENFKVPLKKRKIILVKGYEHKFGRGLNVIKALGQIVNELYEYEVVVFGAHDKVINYIVENKLPFNYYDRQGLSHLELMELMGKSLIYIGNSVSDGLPNTLLEAIIMGVFPIQSNPGGASHEIIMDSENGLLINNPERIDEIKRRVLQTLINFEMLKKAKDINFIVAQEKLNYISNKNKIIGVYAIINESR